MLIQIDKGFGHGYGPGRWRTIEVPDAETLADAAYRAIRKTHDSLTDENHTYFAGPNWTEWGGKVSYWHSVVVYRGPGAPPYFGPPALETSYWFSVPYREVPAPGSAAAIADDDWYARQARIRGELEAERAAKRAKKLAREAARQSRAA